MTDLRETLADIHHDLTDIMRDLEPAIHNLSGRTTTGFATSTRPAGTSTATGQSNPVLAIVAAADNGRGPHAWSATQPHPDHHTLVDAIRRAERALRQARGIVHKHTPHDQDGADEGTPGCNSCARIGVYSDRHRGGLCRWCYDWRTARDSRSKGPDMPALELVRAHHDGERMTPRTLRTAGVRP